MEILLATAYTALFIFLIGRMRFFTVDGLSKRTLSLLFLLKIVTGIVLTLIYTYHYTYRNNSDAFRYFDDAKIIYGALKSSPGDFVRMLTGIDAGAEHLQSYYSQMQNWSRGYNGQLYNDNRTIIRFNALLYLFSTGHYHVHTVFMCFISFTGLTALYKTFYPYLAHLKKVLIVSVFLIPSVLFWGSGVLKEGIILFALGLLVYNFHKLLFKEYSTSTLCWLILSVVILCITKYYVLIALLPSLLGLRWTRNSPLYASLKYSTLLLGFFLLVVCTHSLFPQYDVLKTLTIKQADFINLARGGTYLYNDKHLLYIRPEDRSIFIALGNDSTYKIKDGSAYDYWKVDNLDTKLKQSNSHDTSIYKLAWDITPAGSRIIIPELEPSVWSFVKNTPNALFNTLFRPFVFESLSPFILLAGLENLVLILLILLCIIFPATNTEKRLVWFCFSFVFIVYTLVGLITPVAGAIVRYKVPALPFLAIGLLLMIDKQKMLARMPFMKKMLS